MNVSGSRTPSLRSLFLRGVPIAKRRMQQRIAVRKKNDLNRLIVLPPHIDRRRGGGGRRGRGGARVHLVEVRQRGRGRHRGGGRHPRTHLLSRETEIKVTKLLLVRTLGRIWLLVELKTNIVSQNNGRWRGNLLSRFCFSGNGLSGRVYLPDLLQYFS